MAKSRSMMTLWVLLAIVFAALTVFYLTVNTSFLASATGKHYKHAVLFAALAVLSLVAASFARPRDVGA
jgi:Na+/glutamate symporter